MSSIWDEYIRPAARQLGDAAEGAWENRPWKPDPSAYDESLPIEERFPYGPQEGDMFKPAYDANVDFLNDPSLATGTNMAFHNLLAAGRPVKAGAAAMGGLGAAVGLDVLPDGLGFFSEATAAGKRPKWLQKKLDAIPDMPGLTPEQQDAYKDATYKIQNRKYRSGAERRSLEGQIKMFQDMVSGSTKAAAEAAANTELEKAKIEAKTKAQKERMEQERLDRAERAKQDEYDRSVANAEANRDRLLATDISFQDTETGKVYQQLGGFGPMAAALATGIVHRGAAGPGGGFWGKYGAPAIEGTAAAFGMASAPSYFEGYGGSPTLNPRRQAYEQYALDLPPEHPRKQEFADYAESLPVENPRVTMAREQFQTENVLPRAGAAFLEGAPSAVVGRNAAEWTSKIKNMFGGAGRGPTGGSKGSTGGGGPKSGPRSGGSKKKAGGSSKAKPRAKAKPKAKPQEQQARQASPDKDIDPIEARAAAAHKKAPSAGRTTAAEKDDFWEMAFRRLGNEGLHPSKLTAKDFPGISEKLVKSRLEDITNLVGQSGVSPQEAAGLLAIMKGMDRLKLGVAGAASAGAAASSGGAFEDDEESY